MSWSNNLSSDATNFSYPDAGIAIQTQYYYASVRQVLHQSTLIRVPFLEKTTTKGLSKFKVCFFHKPLTTFRRKLWKWVWRWPLSWDSHLITSSCGISEIGVAFKQLKKYHQSMHIHIVCVEHIGRNTLKVCSDAHTPPPTPHPCSSWTNRISFWFG